MWSPDTTTTPEQICNVMKIETNDKKWSDAAQKLLVIYQETGKGATGFTKVKPILNIIGHDMDPFEANL